MNNVLNSTQWTSKPRHARESSKPENHNFLFPVPCSSTAPNHESWVTVHSGKVFRRVLLNLRFNFFQALNLPNLLRFETVMIDPGMNYRISCPNLSYVVSRLLLLHHSPPPSLAPFCFVCCDSPKLSVPLFILRTQSWYRNVVLCSCCWKMKTLKTLKTHEKQPENWSIILSSKFWCVCA
jgi:hypothetical protein